jgi:hypothetical protein
MELHILLPFGCVGIFYDKTCPPNCTCLIVPPISAEVDTICPPVSMNVASDSNTPIQSLLRTYPKLHQTDNSIRASILESSSDITKYES